MGNRLGNRRGKAVLALALCALAPSVAASQAAPGRLPGTVLERMGREPFRVVVILIDTLRRDRLTFYGQSREKAPFLSRLAAEGAVFERAYAASSWTPTSMASVFTGLYPDQHHVLTGYNFVKRSQARDRPLLLNRIPDAARTLPEMASEAGLATFGVSSNWNIDEVMGFARGFGSFERKRKLTADLINEQAVSWRPRLAAAPSHFLYLHYMDMHGPYTRHAAWFDATEPDERLARYDSSLGYLDSKLRELFDTLGWSERTLIVVLADHGEEFLDHGRLLHPNQLYGELLNIPMLFWWPGVIEPRRVGTPVSQVDLFPTLATLIHRKPVATDSDGIDLVPLLDGGTLPERTLFAMRAHEAANPPIVRRAAVNGRWKYILTSPANIEELYDLETDPREMRNVAPGNPDVAARLRRELEAIEARPKRHTRTFARSERPASELEIELRSLGYVN